MPFNYLGEALLEQTHEELVLNPYNMAFKGLVILDFRGYNAVTKAAGSPDGIWDQDAWTDAQADLVEDPDSYMHDASFNPPAITIINLSKETGMPGLGQSVASINGEIPGVDHFSGAAISATIRFYALTSYFKLDWDEVVYDDADVELERESKDFEWTGANIANGYNHASNFEEDNPTTWNTGAVLEWDYEDFEPPTPPDNGDGVSRRRVVIENLRWTLDPDYTAPTDGSANGLPAV